MRDYSKVGPQFWIGKTGKALRKHGLEAQLVALYLMTSPHANMLGLYYVPQTFIAHETGLGMEGAMKGLQGCIEAGFCRYDEDSEVVWVIEMARFQVGDQLKDKDLRIKGVQNEYDSLPENPYLSAFYDMYAKAFCMSSKRGQASPSEAPSKPLVSQEQEQEQEQEGTPPLPASPPTRLGELCVLLRRAGVNTSPDAVGKVDWSTNPGVTDDVVRRALDTAKKRSPRQITPAYLTPIIADLLVEAKAAEATKLVAGRDYV